MKLIISGTTDYYWLNTYINLIDSIQEKNDNDINVMMLIINNNEEIHLDDTPILFEFLNEENWTSRINMNIIFISFFYIL